MPDPNPNISQVEVNNTTYDICDAVARDNMSSEHQYDIDWTPLPLTDAVAYGETSAPIYARYGKIVQVCGAAKPKVAQTAGATITIGNLPEHYRPYNNVTLLNQGSSQDQWCFTIIGTRSLETSEWGDLQCARYQAGGTLKAYGTTTWLPFSTAFIAAD